jgi:hypothetical protein
MNLKSIPGNHWLFVATILIGANACGQQKKTEYPLQVGDIYFDAKLDDATFKVCDDTRVMQYYNFGNGLQYKGEKIAIDEHFLSKYKSKGNEEGYVTIRFIVNCNGQSGRFRIEGMDVNYNEKKFSKEITDQLLALTTQLNGWEIGTYENTAYDYYQYLTFKIENGKLIEIMP